MISQTAKRLGRPLRKPVEGARYSLGLKVTGATKKRVDNAAKASGRTQSQECEMRIEWSFKEQDLLPNVLELAYGRDIAALVQQFAEAAKTVELQHLREAGLPPAAFDIADVVNEFQRAAKVRAGAQPGTGETFNLLGGKK